jgi:hypothetical protein
VVYFSTIGVTTDGYQRGFVVVMVLFFCCCSGLQQEGYSSDVKSRTGATWIFYRMV